jgi:predicted TIM-barrel fold metal-dependent hydrolase
MSLNDHWLNQVCEDIIDSGLPIIEAHHHLCLGAPAKPFPHDYLVPELERDITAGHNVIASTYVECHSAYRISGPVYLEPVGETEWVNALAEQFAREHPGGTDICAAIVAYADLMDAAHVDEVLEAHQTAAPKRFKGIRYACAHDPDPALGSLPVGTPSGRLADPAFRKGFARLARRDLTFDALVFHPQIAELVELAQKFPDVAIVANHLGYPVAVGRFAGKRNEVFREWRASIAELARCPNVYMKLGGAALRRFGFGWSEHDRDKPPGSDEIVAAAGPLFRAAIEAFSPARCIFESNFPMDRLGCSYAVLWNAFKKMATGYSESERDDMVRNTAARAYRLPHVVDK